MTAQDVASELLRQQRVLARFGEPALKSADLDDILTEACRLVSEALEPSLRKSSSFRRTARRHGRVWLGGS
jgi:hypothetical protein